MSVKRLVKLGRKGPKKNPSSRDGLLSGIDYVLLSGGGSLLSGFTVERPADSGHPDHQEDMQREQAKGML